MRPTLRSTFLPSLAALVAATLAGCHGHYLVPPPPPAYGNYHGGCDSYVGYDDCVPGYDDGAAYDYGYAPQYRAPLRERLQARRDARTWDRQLRRGPGIDRHRPHAHAGGTPYLAYLVPMSDGHCGSCGCGSCGCGGMNCGGGFPCAMGCCDMGCCDTGCCDMGCCDTGCCDTGCCDGGGMMSGCPVVHGEGGGWTVDPHGASASGSCPHCPQGGGMQYSEGAPYPTPTNQPVPGLPSVPPAQEGEFVPPQSGESAPGQSTTPSLQPIHWTPPRP
jgi:hypothetical protein